MNISSANLGIALGAAYGGWIVERLGVNAMGWSAASVAIIVAVLAWLTHALGRTPKPAAALAVLSDVAEPAGIGSRARTRRMPPERRSAA